MNENKKHTILLIEDSADLQELTRELLESEGYQVHCAGNGLAALEFLQKVCGAVDLILLDLRMPVMDGYQFRKMQLLDNTIASIPVVISTADGTANSRVNELKANGFITKAAGIEGMLEVIRRNLNGG